MILIHKHAYVFTHFYHIKMRKLISHEKKLCIKQKSEKTSQNKETPKRRAHWINLHLRMK